MSDDEVNWKQYLSDFHRERPGVAEAVLSRALAGDHTPYRWLARAVSADATTVLDIACGSGPMSRELMQPGRTVIGLDLSEAELAVAQERGPGPWVRGDALRVLAAIAPALRPLGPSDLGVLTRITTRLRATPSFPGPVELAGFTRTLGLHGLRRVEDARQRYRFTVRDRSDAELMMRSLYLPQTRWSRVESAIEHLEDRVARSGPVEVAIPMRRVVAIK